MWEKRVSFFVLWEYLIITPNKEWNREKKQKTKTGGGINNPLNRMSTP